MKKYPLNETRLFAIQPSSVFIVQRKYTRPTPTIHLTKRELEVLSLIIDEFTASDIARILDISPFTVESHWKNLRHKLGVRNTAGIVRVALTQRLVEWQEEWDDPVIQVKVAS